MSAKSHDGDTTGAEMNVTRRRAMQIMGATAVAVAAGTSTAAAQVDDGSEYVPDPTVSGTVTVDEHNRADMSSALEYVDDEGNPTTLADHGGRIAPRPDEETPHNPVSLAANRIRADEFGAFPRGETSENADGDEVDVRVLDATHWSAENGADVGTVEAAHGGDALQVATDGLASGATAVATFDEFDAIDSGELRRYLQVVVDVDDLPADGSAEVAVVDSGGQEAAAVIDPDADADAVDTIATTTGGGKVYQAQLGELADDLDSLEAVEVRIHDADATLTFNALNIERESRWSFGVEEYTNADDELDDRTLYEPAGDYSVTALDTLDAAFSDARLREVEVDVELAASRAPDDATDYELTDAGRYSYDSRFRVVRNVEVPTAYDLSWAGLEATDEVVHPSDRHLSVQTDDSLAEPATLDDVDDADDWGTDRTSSYEDTGLDGKVTVSTAVSPGQTVGVFYDLLLTDDEADDVEDSGVAGGPVGSSGASGWLSGPRGLFLGIVSAVGFVVARARGAIPFMGD